MAKERDWRVGVLEPETLHDARPALGAATWLRRGRSVSVRQVDLAICLEGLTRAGEARLLAPKAVVLVPAAPLDERRARSLLPGSQAHGLSEARPVEVDFFVDHALAKLSPEQRRRVNVVRARPGLECDVDPLGAARLLNLVVRWALSNAKQVDVAYGAEGDNIELLVALSEPETTKTLPIAATWAESLGGSFSRVGPVSWLDGPCWSLRFPTSAPPRTH